MTNINNLISKHQNTVANFDFEEKDREFISLKDLEASQPKTKHKILAIFINTKGQFGDQPVFYTKDYMVNAPNHLVELANELRADKDVVDAINAGQLSFEIYSYQGKKGIGYSINLVPSEQDETDDSKGRAFSNDENVPF